MGVSVGDSPRSIILSCEKRLTCMCHSWMCEGLWEGEGIWTCVLFLVVLISLPVVVIALLVIVGQFSGKNWLHLKGNYVWNMLVTADFYTYISRGLERGSRGASFRSRGPFQFLQSPHGMNYIYENIGCWNWINVCGDTWPAILEYCTCFYRLFPWHYICAELQGEGVFACSWVNKDSFKNLFSHILHFTMH